MKENMNPKVELCHLTLLTITDYFSNIIRQYSCHTEKWVPLEKIFYF